MPGVSQALTRSGSPGFGGRLVLWGPLAGALDRVPARTPGFTLQKLECSRQATTARITVHGIMEQGVAPASVGLESYDAMIKRDGRVHSYSGDRGEILGPPEDGQLRKRLPRTFSLIKNES